MSLILRREIFGISGAEFRVLSTKGAVERALVAVIAADPALAQLVEAFDAARTEVAALSAVSKYLGLVRLPDNLQTWYAEKSSVAAGRVAGTGVARGHRGRSRAAMSTSSCRANEPATAGRAVVGNAVHVMKILTGEIEESTESDDGKDKAAEALGKKGGAARRDKLTPERRTRSPRRRRLSGGAAITLEFL